MKKSNKDDEVLKLEDIVKNIEKERGYELIVQDEYGDYNFHEWFNSKEKDKILKLTKNFKTIKVKFKELSK